MKIVIRTSGIRLLFILGSAGLLLAACSVNPGGANRPLTQEAATSLTGVASLSNDYLVAMLGNPTGVAPLTLANGDGLPAPVANLAKTAGLEPQATSQCVIKSGSSDDADGDGLPLDATFSFDCTEMDQGNEAHFEATIHIQDKNDNDPDSGYRVEVPNFEWSETSAGETSKVTLHEIFDLTVASASYSVQYELEVNASSPTESGGLSENATATYTPDDPADPFAAGELVTDGQTTFTSDGKSYSLSEMTTPSLHYAAACSSDFDEGSAQYVDSESNTLTIVYHGCDDVTITYNGFPLAAN